MYSANLKKFEVNDLSTKFVEARNGDDIEEKVKNSIRQHHFNSKIILYLPDSATVPKYVSNLLMEDRSFYCIKNLAVQELCDYNFTKAFVTCGTVLGYSANTKLDEDCSAALIPSGELFLLLNHFKYHELGITGKLSSHILRYPKKKFFIEIKTIENNFRPGKKQYERTHHSFESCPLHFDFFISWQPNDENVCPSSIAKYFHDKGYEVEEIIPSIKNIFKSDVKIPTTFDSEEPDSFEPENVLEWLGMCAADIDVQILNSISPEPTTCLCPFTVTHIEGLYNHSNIKEVIGTLRKWLLDQESETVPWVCLTVYGPPDCLISWSKTEHSFKVNGENFYVLFIFRDKVWYYTVEENKKPQRVYVKSSNKSK